MTANEPTPGWWQRGIGTLSRSVANFLLPPICAGCEQDLVSLHDSLPLCETCLAAFAIPPGAICPRCAAPVPPTSILPTGCIHCESTSFRFHRLAALGVYDKKLEEFVLRMKQPQQEALTLAAGRLLARRIRTLAWEPFPELVTTIPMHWSRRILRGVNSAAILAEAVASELALPLALDIGSVTRMVPRQSSLTPSRRRRNMRGVFHISSAFQLQAAHLLVIDDVLTTGATANAFSQALRLAGSGTISIGVVTRGIGVQ